MAKKYRTKVEKIVVENFLRKQYSYKKGEVALGFSLRTDIPQELSVFKDLLGAAREEVSKDLETLKKK